MHVAMACHDSNRLSYSFVAVHVHYIYMICLTKSYRSCLVESHTAKMLLNKLSYQVLFMHSLVSTDVQLHIWGSLNVDKLHMNSEIIHGNSNIT